MRTEIKNIISSIYHRLYKRDIDKTINVFLCGADTGRTDSIRYLLNTELTKYAKFNVVFPEFIFSTLLTDKNNNLLELEDELAKYVDLIVIPLEGQGTLAEIGAFTVNKKLLPKIIAINNQKYKHRNSFINLGPLDLIKKHNSKNLYFFEEGKESDILEDLLEHMSTKRYSKKDSYELENIFNLTRFIFYLISIFQPVTTKELTKYLNIVTEILKNEKIKLKFIESAIQILTQRNRIEKDFNKKFEETYTLSLEGHKYVYEELIPKLKIKREFTRIRLEILNNKIRKGKKDMDRELKLLELD
jgi:hypothetical protein